MKIRVVFSQLKKKKVFSHFYFTYLTQCVLCVCVCVCVWLCLCARVVVVVCVHKYGFMPGNLHKHMHEAHSEICMQGVYFKAAITSSVTDSARNFLS